MVEKSDDFDEWMLNRQTFPYQNFALRIFLVLHILLTGLDLVCHAMLGHGILKYFRPILDKKDPPEDKEVRCIVSMVSPSYPIHTSCYQRLPPSSITN